MGKTRFADNAAGMRLTAQSYIPAALAGDATKSTPIFCAPDNCKVLQVQVVAQADITGQATDYFNLNLINKGSSGAGTTELANIDFLNASVTATAFKGKGLLANTAVESATALTAGDVLAIERELVNSGLATPELKVVVTYTLV